MQLYKRAFDLCCDQGCLSEDTFERILKATSIEEAKFLLGNNFDYSKKFKTLPPDWSRNNWKDIPIQEKYQNP
jgi:hypothetical protein